MKLSTTVAVRYAGASFDAASNAFQLQHYTLVDLRASYPLTEAVELYGRIENLADEQYQTIRNYGTLGRTAYAGVRARF
jgi:vitamin B12 transporter